MGEKETREQQGGQERERDRERERDGHKQGEERGIWRTTLTVWGTYQKL